MSLKEIVVEGCSLEFQNGGGPNSAIIITSGQASTKVKAEGKGVYKTLKFSVSGYTGQAIDVTGSGSGNGEITATSQNITVEGNKVFLNGDESAKFEIKGKKYVQGGTTDVSVFEIVKVTDAGQTKVKGS